MKKLTVTVVLLVLACRPAAADKENLQQLKARAATAGGGKQVELFTRIAEIQVEELDRAYDEGQAEEARAALADVQEYGVKAARTSEATGKRMKQTEIAIRRIAKKLDEIRKTLAVDERPPVNTAIEQLENARTALLHSMFAK